MAVAGDSLDHDLVALEEVREAWARQAGSPHAKVLLQVRVR
jgi:hypothetical protein